MRDALPIRAVLLTLLVGLFVGVAIAAWPKWEHHRVKPNVASADLAEAINAEVRELLAACNAHRHANPGETYEIEMVVRER